MPARAQVESDAQDAPADLNGPYTPPVCTGTLFSDVTCSTPFDAWIEQYARDGITAGCGGGAYCPNGNVTRAQMAVFIEKAMRGTANWPAHTQIVWAVKAADGSPDPVASGTALLNAVAAIPTSGNDAPSSSNPWLVKVGPGVFNLNGDGLTLPDHVNLDGAGQSVTTIQSAAATTPVLSESGNTSSVTVSNVKIFNNTNTVTSEAVSVSNYAHLTLDRVYVQAGSGTVDNIGIWVEGGASVDISDSFVQATGVSGSEAISVNGSPQYEVVRVWRTRFSATTYDVNSNANALIQLVDSNVQAALTNTGGTYQCFGDYNASLGPVTCP